MITFRRTTGYGADLTHSAGELSFSLLGHCEERRTGAETYDVVEIRPLSFTRRPAGLFYRIATPAIEVISGTRSLATG